MPIYMKFSGPDAGARPITGSSQEPGHPGWVVLESLSWSIHSASTRSTGSAANREDSVPRDRDIQASTHDAACLSGLFLAVVHGGHFKKVEVEYTHREENGEKVYLKLELTDVIVSSAQTMGNSKDNDSIPGLAFALTFGQIKFQYMDASKAAPPAGGWTLKPSPPAKKTK